MQALVLGWRKPVRRPSFFISCAGIDTKISTVVGMHRDGLNVWHMRPRDAELRRRVWCEYQTLGTFSCTDIQVVFLGGRVLVHRR